MHAVLRLWKVSVSSTLENVNNLVIQNLHLIKNIKFFRVNKLTSREIILVLILAIKAMSQMYYEKLNGKIFTLYLV